MTLFRNLFIERPS